MSLKRALLVLLVVGLIVVYVTFDLSQWLSLERFAQERAALAVWVGTNWATALAIYVAVYIAVAALSLPGAAVLTLVGGALFGWLIGVLAVSVASTIGATLAFLISRYLFRDAVRERFGPRLAALEQGMARDGAYYLFTLRLVPVFPFFVVNLLMGLTPIRTHVYALVSQAGMLPATVVYVYAGTQLGQVQSVKDVLSPGLLIAFALLGVFPLVVKKLLELWAARRVYRGFGRPRRFDYNLIVIGAGSAGLVSAYIAAAIKAKVALIEKHKMGGDCLNTGCVPSKALIRSSRLLADARRSTELGIRAVEMKFDFAEVMERVQRVIKAIEPHDSVERYRGLGVDCIDGEARLVSPWEVEVGGKRLSARSLIVATGARPLVPPLPGLDQIDYLTSDNIWSLRELPKRLLVLGGGPIGTELAQAFARFGSAVTIVEMASRLLPREDEDVSTELMKVLRAEGLTLATGHTALRFEPADDHGVLIAEVQGQQVRLEFDRVLVALGRKANVTGFGLEELGVRISPRGTVEADPWLRTNFPNISVCGDVTGPYQFTHVAAHQAWYAAVNQLLSPFWRYRADYRVIPWATFTEPQVARVGLNETDAKEQNIAFELTRYGIDDLDRAIADEAAHGFVKVLTRPGSDEILGATIVGPEAGELIAEFVLAMKHGIGLNKLLGTIHTYPTLMEANKYAAGVWKRAHAPAAALVWAQRFFAWRRG